MTLPVVTKTKKLHWIIQTGSQSENFLRSRKYPAVMTWYCQGAFSKRHTRLLTLSRSEFILRLYYYLYHNISANENVQTLRWKKCILESNERLVFASVTMEMMLFLMLVFRNIDKINHSNESFTIPWRRYKGKFHSMALCSCGLFVAK